MSLVRTSKKEECTRHFRFPMVKTKARKAILALAAIGAVFIAIALARSVQFAKLSIWEKELEGESIWQVEGILSQKGLKLRPGGADSLERNTGQILKPNERVLFYVKGEQYSWSGGTIVHLRYLVIDWDRKVVVRVIPDKGRDSL